MTELEKFRFCSPHYKGHHRMLRTKGQRLFHKGHMYQIITLCTFNLHDVVCQLYLNKPGEKLKKEFFQDCCDPYKDFSIVNEK